MRTPWIVVAAFCSAGILAAQSEALPSLPDSLRIARERREAGDPLAAVSTLLPFFDTNTAPEHDAALADELGELGLALLRRGPSAAAAAARVQSFAAAVRRRMAGGADRLETADALRYLATALEMMGRGAEGVAPCREALAIRDRLRLEDDVGEALTLDMLGNCLQSSGQLEEALRSYEAALGMLRELVEEPDGAIASVLNNVASCTRALGRPEDAIGFFRQSFDMQMQLAGQRPNVGAATTLHNMGGCLLEIGRRDEAVSTFERALAMNGEVFGDRDVPSTAMTLNSLATCLLTSGRERDAIPLLERALGIRERIWPGMDHPHTANSMHNLAIALQGVGKFDEAMQRSEAALAMRQRLCRGRDDGSVVESLEQTASCLRAIGRDVEALPLLEAGLAMERRLSRDRRHSGLAKSLGNLGMLFDALGRHEDALEHVDEAIAALRKLPAERHRDELLTMRNARGCILMALRRFDEAAAELRSVVADRRATKEPGGDDTLAIALSNLGTCLGLCGDLGAAAAHLREALELRKHAFGDRDHIDVSYGLNSLGTCLAMLGQRDEGLQYSMAALAMRERLLCGHDSRLLVASLGNVATALTALGRPKEALPHAERAVAMIERLRAAGRRLSASSRRELFDELKSSDAFERLQLVQISMDRAEAAFETAERSRGRDLLDAFEAQCGDALADAARQAKLRGDEGVARRIDALRREVADAGSEMDRLLSEVSRIDVAAADPASRASRLTELQTKLRETAKTERRLLDECARLVSDRVTLARPRSSDDIRAALREGELLLEFTVLPDQTLLYVVSRRGVEVHRRPVANDVIERAVDRWLRPISRARIATRGRDPNPTGAVDEKSSETLSSELFAHLIPAELWQRIRACKRVWIAPHRCLHRVPFEALVVATEGQRRVPWLDAGPPIDYVPSGSVLEWLRRRAEDQRDDTTALDLLAVGDPTASREGIVSAPADTQPRDGSEIERIGRLPPLRGARDEVVAIAAAFPDRSRTRTLLGEEALTSTVHEMAPRASYLHFACHGIAEEYAGQSLSMLVLALPAQAAGEATGFLRLTELMQNWRGRLASTRCVVLSACRTGVGPSYRDDSPHALPIGFLQAGAASVIGTLWAVDDTPTRDLMVDFYRRVMAGERDRLRAFTEARKAAFSRSPDPFHWAPFRYTGSPD